MAIAKKSVRNFLVFLSCNFLALYVGVQLMNDGPRTAWYAALNKAPWSPPNWMFGVAWSSIMLLFAFYMTRLVKNKSEAMRSVLGIYALQWLLNVGWNWFFFNQHQTKLGLVVIVSLCLLILMMMFGYRKKMAWNSLMILPYAIWMVLATSLNAYIVFNN
jgi:tryptophan-rich sensory protein